MDKKQEQKFKVPGFLLAIILILVISIIFIFAVQVPFSQNYDTYQKDHASAVSQISLWKDYLAREPQVQSYIDELKKEYESKSGSLYSNATTSPDDVRTMLKSFKYDILSLSINTGVVDSQKRKNVAGGFLYSTAVNFRFVGTEENIIQTLNYLELEAPGAYYVNNINIVNYKEKETVKDQGTSKSDKTSKSESGDESAAEEPADDDAEEIELSTTSNAAVTAGSKYEVTINMSLYYFVEPVTTTSGSGASGASGAKTSSSASSKSSK